MFPVPWVVFAEQSEKAGKTKQIAGRGRRADWLAGQSTQCGSCRAVQPLKKKKIPNSPLDCFYLSTLHQPLFINS